MLIHNQQDVQNAAAVLHDARLLAQQTYDDCCQHQLLALPLWVVDHRGEKPRQVWCKCTLVVPYITCHFDFRGQKVESYYEIATLRYDEVAKTLRIVTHYVLDVILTVGELRAHLEYDCSSLPLAWKSIAAKAK